MSEQPPAFLQEMLRACPPAGEGVHAWLFKVARNLHAHMTALQIVDLLARASANCGRFVPRSEIVSAVQNSIGCAWQSAGQSQPIHAEPKWPAVNLEQREAIIRDGGALVDLWEDSPARFDEATVNTEEFVDLLFPGNPLLCCGRSNADFDTKPREDWRGELRTLQLIVPSPMSAIRGKTKDGRASKHTLENTGPRRFLVIEFDQGDVDDHAALLLHLAEGAPLALAVHSGNKSLHAWFYCAGQTEERLHRFMSYCVALGADPSTWTRSQFVRMPDGLRDGGKRQVAYYFNPEAIQ